MFYTTTIGMSYRIFIMLIFIHVTLPNLYLNCRCNLSTCHHTKHRAMFYKTEKGDNTYNDNEREKNKRKMAIRKQTPNQPYYAGVIFSFQIKEKKM